MATPIPENRAPFAVADLLRATGGALAGVLERGLVVPGISTDTRTLARGQAFVALAGEHHDGHERLAEAAARGASLAFVEREVAAPAGLAVVHVQSTLAALGAIAASHLARWRGMGGERRVACITGSAGKTTTKLATAALLRGALAERGMDKVVLCPAGNLNNRIGVPMSILCLAPEERFAVLELGTNQPGEIPALAALCTPDVAVLTLVASAHSERLGDVAAIAREKAALFAHLAPGATAVGNADDARVAHALCGAPASRRLGYGFCDDTDYRVVACAHELVEGAVRSRLRVARRAGGELVFATPLLGRAGALACAAALAVVETWCGTLEGAVVERALAPLAALDRGGRLELRRRADGLVVLDDSYNANPASAENALACACELAASLGRPLVLVLGEMRELGAEAKAAHAALGAAAGGCDARLLVAVGGELAEAMAVAARACGLRVEVARDADAAARVAAAAVDPGDLVLVKGSRGVRTEKVVLRLVADVRESRTPAGAAVHREGA